MISNPHRSRSERINRVQEKKHWWVLIITDCMGMSVFKGRDLIWNIRRVKFVGHTILFLLLLQNLVWNKVSNCHSLIWNIIGFWTRVRIENWMIMPTKIWVGIISSPTVFFPLLVIFFSSLTSSSSSYFPALWVFVKDNHPSLGAFYKTSMHKIKLRSVKCKSTDARR